MKMSTTDGDPENGKKDPKAVTHGPSLVTVYLVSSVLTRATRILTFHLKDCRRPRRDGRAESAIETPSFIVDIQPVSGVSDARVTVVEACTHEDGLRSEEETAR